MRTDQFLIDGDTGGLILIDLDGVCLAEPARDLGNLLAYLDWKAIRRPGDGAFLERAAAALLSGYGTGRPVPADRVAAYRARVAAEDRRAPLPEPHRHRVAAGPGPGGGRGHPRRVGSGPLTGSRR
jgi:aminoglycoside phosphotransferase (APT) family kinase protein